MEPEYTNEAAAQLVENALLLSARDRIRHFINNLPILSKSQIPLDDNCPICLVSFASILEESEKCSDNTRGVEIREEEIEGEEKGITKVEGCGHIFCRRDLAEWVRTLHGSCPACRSYFVPPSILAPLREEEEESSDGGEYIPPSDFDYSLDEYELDPEALMLELREQYEIDEEIRRLESGYPTEEEAREEWEIQRMQDGTYIDPEEEREKWENDQIIQSMEDGTNVDPEEAREEWENEQIIQSMEDGAYIDETTLEEMRQQYEDEVEIERMEAEARMSEKDIGTGEIVPIVSPHQTQVDEGGDAVMVTNPSIFDDDGAEDSDYHYDDDEDMEEDDYSYYDPEEAALDQEELDALNRDLGLTDGESNWSMSSFATEDLSFGKGPDSIQVVVDDNVANISHSQNGDDGSK